MLQEIPLSDEERAAIDGDVQALTRLLERLKDVPPPGKERQHLVIPLEGVRRLSGSTKESRA
jgi:hypothetical protein